MSTRLQPAARRSPEFFGGSASSALSLGNALPQKAASLPGAAPPPDLDEHETPLVRRRRRRAVHPSPAREPGVHLRAGKLPPRRLEPRRGEACEERREALAAADGVEERGGAAGREVARDDAWMGGAAWEGP